MSAFAQIGNGCALTPTGQEVQEKNYEHFLIYAHLSGCTHDN
jgi:hypothetical protein